MNKNGQNCHDAEHNECPDGLKHCVSMFVGDGPTEGVQLRHLHLAMACKLPSL